VTVIVLLGPPGAGKGTQAEVLQEKLGLPHIATGDLFRAALREGTPIGREARRYMDRGQLVPDDITIRMLLARLDQRDAAGGVLLDGFPRTRAQAEALDTSLAERGSKVDVALNIDVPSEEVVRRMSGRWICEAAGHVYHQIANPPRVPGRCDIDGSRLIQREDDRIETVRARLAQQLGALRDVVGYYRSRGTLRTVDGRRPIDEVTDALLAEVAAATPGAA
jgi:adenylate kinase